MGKDSFFGGNLLGQESWELRGANEGRIRSLETSRTADEATLALIQTGVFTPYLPTDQNIVVGNGTRLGGYARIGRLIALEYDLLWGTTTSFGGNASIGLPVAAVADGRHHTLAVSILDNGTRYYIGAAVIGEVSASLATLMHTEAGNAGFVNATNPMTWTSGDRFTVTGIYEAAS